MRIQHNVMAMSAYRYYTDNSKGLKKNLERLSGGYKISRAGDDAAGLAISERMRAQITGLEVARDNAKDGISLVQTAEGALTEVHDMLNRMVELANQSANGTYSNDTDRVQLQKELDLLRDEVNRIADSANFNGITLLDGSMDGGGDTVFARGLFQFDAEHPAGIAGGNRALPPLAGYGVEPVRGTHSILHTEGTSGGEVNAFSIDLENLKVNKDGSIDITVGDGLTITIMNETGGEITAGDIVKAIENKVKKGANEGGVSVFFDGAKIAMDGDGGKLDIGGTQFKLSADGSRLTFTQTGDGAGIDMPRTVTVTDADTSAPTVDGAGSIEEEATTSGPAKYKIDLRTVDMTAPGNITVKIFDQEFDLKITSEEFKNRANKSIGEVLAGKLADALSKAGFEDDPDAGALSFRDNGDGTVTLAFQNAGAVPSDKYDLTTISVTTAVYQDGDTVTVEDDVNVGNPGSGGVQSVSSVSVKIGGDTYKFTLVPDVLIGKPGYEYDSNADNVVVTTPGEGFENKVIEKLNKILEEKNKQNKANNANYNAYVNTRIVKVNGEYRVLYEKIDKRSIGISGGTGGGSGGGAGGGSGSPGGTEENFSGDWNAATTVLRTKSEDTQKRLASTVLTLTEDMYAEGSAITIGRDTYTFTTDRSKLGKDGYVVYTAGEDVAAIAVRLTEAAKDNGTYTVGHDKNGRITLLEKEDQKGFDLTTMAGIEKSLGFKTAATRDVDTSKGLTLQIGDTAEGYNQLKVNIRDCHTRVLGLDQISIASQTDAGEAVGRITDAITYVSDVRGTLGATQNRLDHTINNLSVMTENIQDAESTIRDTDIAEEIMSYTKNNILIQAAQAMLAQANQVPQGVLQLLQ